MRYKTFRTLLIGGCAAAAGTAIFVAATRPPRSSQAPPPPVTAVTREIAPTPVAPIEAAPAAAPQAVAAPQVPAGGAALRDIDRRILALQARGIAGDKVKDALPSTAEKVNLFRDAGSSYVNRLKIDLDRDGKWDEKWSFDMPSGALEVKRQVAPADEEVYTREYRLRAGAWAPK